MLNKIVQHLSNAVSRRSFIGRFASGCSALVLSVLGMGRLAVAGGGPGCCVLCANKPTCSANPSCAAKWCWTCPSGSGSFCRIFQCLECFGIDHGCHQYPCAEGGVFCDLCSNVICNHAINTGLPCF
jgi:hypothetical protein